MPKQIIAVQGYKNSGKDTVAEMLQYLLNSPKIFRSYFWFNILQFKNKFKIVSYAKTLKDMLAVMLNIDVLKFEDRNFKENYHIDFSTLEFIHKSKCPKSKMLSDSKFAKEIKNVNPKITEDYNLSIRQLLQYFGTEIMRNYFGDKLWINTTLKSKHAHIIISDQRFEIENEVVEQNEGLIIHVHRPGCKKGTHLSEIELEQLYKAGKYHHFINNDGDLKKLFNTCKKLTKYVNNN